MTGFSGFQTRDYALRYMSNAGSKTEDKVHVSSIEYDRMALNWPLLEDLLGGTSAMREARHNWLPREPRESHIAYENRLARSFLYNAFGDTVEKLVAKPFSRPVTVQGDIPKPLDLIEKDVDMSGRDVTQLCRDVFRSLVVYGVSHILIDFPKTDGIESLADERARKIRPTLVHVSPTQLIGWRTERQANGRDRLTQIRLKQKQVEPKGDFIEEEVEYIRVITPNTFEVWRKGSEDDDFVQVEAGSHTFGEVPLVSCYAARTGFLTAKPPLLDLAHLNLAHWQSMSDQRNVLRFARVGILFASGFTDEEIEDGLTIGPNQLVHSNNPEARIQYVEHNGHAIEAGANDLESLERRMEALGLQPLLPRTGSQTATARAMDESRVDSAIQSWIRSVENCIRDAYLYAADWMKVRMPDDLDIDINNDFGVSLRASDDVKSLIEMRKQSQLTLETFLRECKRRGLLAETLDVDDEIEMLLAEEAIHRQQAMAALDDLGIEEEPEEEDGPEEPEGETIQDDTFTDEQAGAE
jgi:hypothetical protein